MITYSFAVIVTVAEYGPTLDANAVENSQKSAILQKAAWDK